jgi:hypothetical protein
VSACACVTLLCDTRLCVLCVSGGRRNLNRQRNALLGLGLGFAVLRSHHTNGLLVPPALALALAHHFRAISALVEPDLGVQVLRLHAGHRTVKACQCSVAASRLILTCRQVHASLNWIALGRSRHTILPVTLSSHNASVCSVEEPKAG